MPPAFRPTQRVCVGRFFDAIARPMPLAFVTCFAFLSSHYTPTVPNPAPVSSSLDDYLIPPLPSSLAQVLSIVSNNAQDQATRPITEAVASDPDLSAYVLRRVNSPYYGVSRHVESVEKAVRLLGGKTVCEIALEAGLRQVFPYMETAAAQNVYTAVMQGSIMTAHLAQAVADALHVPHYQQAYLAGLLQQVGRLVLLQQKPQAYAAVWYGLSEDAQAEDAHSLVCPSRADEQQAIGIDYVATGRKVAAHWHLPTVVQACIRYQHAPDEVVHVPYRPIVHVTRVANLWAYHAILDALPADEPPSLSDAPPAFTDALQALAHLRKKSPEDLFDLIASRQADALEAVTFRTG